MNSWVLIGLFSVAVAFILVQLFKFFVTAPELAAQEEATKRKNAKKGQPSQKNKPKSTESTTSSGAIQESINKIEEVKKKVSVASPVVSSPVHPESDGGKDKSKQKPSNAPKQPKSKDTKPKAKEHDFKASSGSDLDRPVKEASGSEKIKKDKGKKPEKESKKPKIDKKAREFATELTEEELVNWRTDYQPSAADSAPQPVAAPQAWKQVGSTDAQVEDYKRQIATQAEESQKEREILQARIDKLREEAQTEHKLVEQARKTIEKLKRELDSVREGKVAEAPKVKWGAVEKQAGPSLSSVIADEHKQKEKEKESKGKEKEVERQADDKSDRQIAGLKQRVAELEAKHKELSEQLKASEAVNNYLTASLASEVSSRPKESKGGDASSNKKIEELTQQVKSLTAQLRAAEQNAAKGGEGDAQIKQLQKSLQDEKDKTEQLQQQNELANAATDTYKRKLDEAQTQKNTTIAQLEERLAEATKRVRDLESEKATQNQAQSGEAAKLLDEANARAEEANRRTQEATTRVDEAAKHVQDLNQEIVTLRKRLEDSEKARAQAEDASKDQTAHAEQERKYKEEIQALNQKIEATEASYKDAQAQVQTLKDLADKANATLEEEKAARTDVVKRLEEVSARVKELETPQQQAAGTPTGLKFVISSPSRLSSSSSPSDSPQDSSSSGQ